MALLEVREVTVEYRRPRRPPVRAVAGVDLGVDRGQIVGLVGESGCGKSTLARAIVGLLPCASGSVTLDGRAVRPLGRGARPVADRSLQMIFQDPYASLNPRRRVWRQLADGVPRDDRRDARDRSAELLTAVGLSPDAGDRYPHEFSGGQRQRIAIARALAAEPSVIVADEAVSALDASTQAQVANLLVDLARGRGLGLLFISHDLSVVRHMADSVSVMYLGRIVESAPTGALWSQPLHPYSEALIQAVPGLGPGAQPPTGLPGEVGDPARPPAGCRFHPRCPYSHERCLVEDPAAVTIVPRRRPACWLQPAGGPPRPLDEVAPAEVSS